VIAIVNGSSTEVLNDRGGDSIPVFRRGVSTPIGIGVTI
jgi:hypothetical protein